MKTNSLVFLANLYVTIIKNFEYALLDVFLKLKIIKVIQNFYYFSFLY